MITTNTMVRRVTTVQSFYKRKDRYWFEKLSRSKSDKEVVDFFVSNFITCTDPRKLWIGEMISQGEGRYTQSMEEKNSVSFLHLWGGS